MLHDELKVECSMMCLVVHGSVASGLTVHSPLFLGVYLNNLNEKSTLIHFVSVVSLSTRGVIRFLRLLKSVIFVKIMKAYPSYVA